MPISLLPFFLHFVRPYWKGLLVVFITSLAWTADFTVWPYLLKEMVDTMLVEGGKPEILQLLIPVLVQMTVLWCTVEVMYRLQGFSMARLFPKLEADIRLAMFDDVQKRSYRFFSEHFAGSVANKISDMPQSITRMTQIIFSLFIPAFFGFFFSTWIMSTLHPMYGWIVGGWAVFHVSVCVLTARRCDHLAEIHSEIRSDLQGKIVDSLTNSAVVRAFSRYSDELRFLRVHQDVERAAQYRSLLFIEKVKLILGPATFFGAGTILIGAMIYGWYHDILTPGEVVMVFNTSWNVTMMAWMFGLQLPNFFREMGVCAQALSIIRMPHEVLDKPDATALQVTRGEIRFENVSFAYGETGELFSDKNVVLAAGSRTGLVGESGGGKTSFVHLILRHFDLNSGKILIDGQDISHVTQESLRNAIALIPQDTTLFHRSLMENIRVGKPDASDEEVIEASKRAHCHEFISSMHGEYGALVGERGVKLSGGQRQRIAIARAFLKNAPILILDEATSALDSITEKYIQESLLELMHGRTVIVIAHRLSTLLSMERVLVFDHGVIVEDGTHDALLENGGHYAKLWQMQAGGFVDAES